MLIDRRFGAGVEGSAVQQARVGPGCGTFLARAELLQPRKRGEQRHVGRPLLVERPDGRPADHSSLTNARPPRVAPT